MRHFSFLLLLWIGMACAGSVFAQSFRFALVTDIHLKQSDPTNANNLRLTVNDINQQKKIDFVLVAGDIAHEGDRPSLLKAKQLLDSLKIPYYIIPGNHDTRHCKTITDTFDSVFVQHHFAFTHKGYFFIGFNTGQGHGSNRGKVTAQELSWINGQLSKHAPRKPVIAVTHFPLVTVQEADSAVVVGTLLKYHTKAILGGHYHRNVVFDYGGVPGILTRTLQPNHAGKCGYSIFELSDNLKVTEKNPADATSFEWFSFPLKKEKVVH
jgi:3',5'-cyclic AMP phosphodiesterase CpdA